MDRENCYSIIQVESDLVKHYQTIVKTKILRIALILSLIGGCAKEPIYEIPPPVIIKSWLEYKDTNWNGLINVNTKPVRVKSVSNFVVISNGADTSLSIRFNFSNINSNLEQVAIKFKKGLAKNGNQYTSNSIENVYVETYNAVFFSNDIKIDSIYFRLTDFPANNTYTVEDLYFTAKTNSISQPNTQFTLEASSLQVLKSFFYYYEKGKKVNTEKELLNVDLKGGNEFSPSPLLDYKPDLRSPNDLFFINIPTESLINAPDFDAKNAIRYSKKGKFHPAQNGTINVQKFHYKNSIYMTGKNWVVNDTTLNTNIISIDSVRLQQFAMPF